VRRWSRLVLSLALTGACLGWTFKDTEWAGMWASLKSAQWWVLLPYLAIMAGVHVARTLRWGHLLSGLERVPFRTLNEAAAIGFMMLLVLPLRLGEFARPLLIARRTGIRSSAAMPSIVFERIVDGIVVAVLLRALIPFLPPDAPHVDEIRFAANVVFLIFSAGIAVLVLARWKHDFMIDLMRRTAGRVAPGLTDRVIAIVDGFLTALRQLPDARNTAMFFVWTAVFWALNGLSVMVLAGGFDCAAATGTCAPLSLDLYQAFFVLAVMVVGTMIPLAPGSAGTAQLAMVIALSLFFPEHVVNSSGVAWANVHWLVWLGHQILFGLIMLVVSHVSFRAIAGELRSGEGQAPP
jgi:uncharacterized protein (TIRG00374 family)